MISNKFVRDRADITRLLFRKEYIQAEHTHAGHFYRCYMIDGHPLYKSVTTKTQIISEPYLKDWAVKKTVEHVKANGHRLPQEIDKVLLEAANVHSDIFKESGELGTEAHSIIESYIMSWIETGERPHDIRKFIININTIDTRILSAVIAAQDFMTSQVIVPVKPELLVGSGTLKVAGTLDFLAYVGTVTREGKKGVTPLPIHEWYWSPHSKDKDSIYIQCPVSFRQIRFDLTIIDWKTSNRIDKPHYPLQVSAYHKCLQETYKLKAKRVIVVRLDKTTAKFEYAELLPEQIRTATSAYTKGVSPLAEWLDTPHAELHPAKKQHVIMKTT